MSLLSPLFLPNHNQIAFRQLRGNRPNRICFSGAHHNALRENSGAYASKAPYKFTIPFNHGVAAELHDATGISLRKSDYGFWIGLSEYEAQQVRTWMQGQGCRVYLKDFFDCSIALSERTADTTETEIGSLFTAAKYQDDAGARISLGMLLGATWDAMRTFPKAGVITCPPPRLGKAFDLPSALAERLAKHAGLPFIQLGEWQGEKGQLKEVAAEKKWDYLQSVGFTVNAKILQKAEHVLIIDDIYQSGTTINFLRSCLTAKGVARASAISIVKAARDTDNQ